MPGKTILYATDFSEISRLALPYATSLALAKHCELLIVYVQQPVAPCMFGDGYYCEGSRAYHEQVCKRLEAIRPENSTVGFKHRLLWGDPAEAITRLAQEEPVEAIVLASHGRTGLPRVLLGSVAEQVFRLAKCPVLIVKPKDNATAPLPRPALEATH